jgi:hypothetical protein
MKMAVFWEFASCNLNDNRVIMEAVSTSETSVNIYQTTRSNIQEDYIIIK